MLEHLLGLAGLTAGDQVACLLGQHAGLVQRVGVSGLRLLGGAAQQGLAGVAVTAGNRGVGGPAQQAQRPWAAVPVQQPDRVLAQLVRVGGRAGAQGGDGPDGRRRGDSGVIGEQREAGQLQVQAGRPLAGGAAPGIQQRPGGHARPGRPARRG